MTISRPDLNPTDLEGEPTLDELFQKDYLELTDQQLDRVVAALREQREGFVVADAKAATTGKAVKSPKNVLKAAPPLTELNLFG